MDSITDTEIEAHLEVVDADGSVVVRIDGWTDKRIDMPDDFFRFRMSPLEEKLSQPAPFVVSNLSASHDLACRRIFLDHPLLRTDGGIWHSVLAHLVLSRHERSEWSRLATSERERTEWLLERVVAKDAARSFAAEHWQLDWYPADIEIFSDGDNRPLIKCPENAGRTLSLSLDHSDGYAVALVGDRAQCQGLTLEGKQRTPECN